MPLSIVTKFT